MTFELSDQDVAAVLMALTSERNRLRNGARELNGPRRGDALRRSEDLARIRGYLTSIRRGNP